MTDVDNTIRSLRRTRRDGRYHLMRIAAEDVIAALEKHSFVLKDRDLWKAANMLSYQLKEIRNFEESGFWVTV